LPFGFSQRATFARRLSRNECGLLRRSHSRSLRSSTATSTALLALVLGQPKKKRHACIYEAAWNDGGSDWSESGAAEREREQTRKRGEREREHLLS